MAVDTFTTYNIENSDEFNRSIEEAILKVSDLRPAFELIASDFYRSQKAIFKLKSRGQYPELAESTIKQKQSKYGRVYPILKATGRLERSVTKRGANENITLIGKRFLVLGTSTFYGIYHQEGLGVPSRPFLFVGPESSAFANKDRSGQGGRLTRWTNIIEAHVVEQTENS